MRLGNTQVGFYQKFHGNGGGGRMQTGLKIAAYLCGDKTVWNRSLGAAFAAAAAGAGVDGRFESVEWGNLVRRCCWRCHMQRVATTNDERQRQEARQCKGLPERRPQRHDWRARQAVAGDGGGSLASPWRPVWRRREDFLVRCRFPSLASATRWTETLPTLIC